MILRAKDENSAAVFSGIAKEAQGMVAGVKSALSGLIAIDIVSGIKDGIGAIFGGAIEAADGVGRLQAQLGLTQEQAQQLGGVAQDVFRSGFGESVGEVNEVLATVRQNLGDLGPELTQVMAQNALTIKDLFGASEAESTRTVGVMTKNFQGLSETDAFDLITAGFQQGGDYSGELLDTLREYSPQFASMGMNAEQMLGVLIKGAQAGAFNMDKVGDAVKEFNIRAKDGSKSTSEGFAAIGLDAAKMGADIAAGGEKGQRAFQATIAGLAAMEDPVKRNAAGVALFGSQWEDLESQVITAMANGMQGVEGFRGSTAAAAQASAGIGVQFETLKRQAMGLLIDGITPLMPGFMTLATGAIGSLTSMIAPIKEIGAALADIFNGGDDWEATGALLERFFPPDVADGIMVVVTNMGALFDSVFVGDIPAAIEGAIGIISGLGDIIVGAVESWASAFASWVDGADTEMTGQLGLLITNLMGWIQTTGEAIVTRLAIWAGAFVDWVAPKIPPLLAALGQLLVDVGVWITTVGAPNLVSKLVEWGAAFVDWVVPRIPLLLAALGGLLGQLGTWIITTAAPAIVLKLVEWGAAFLGWVAKDVLPTLATKLGEILTAVTTWIGGQVQALGESLKAWATAFLAWVATTVTNAPTELGKILTAIKDWISTTVGGLKESAKGIGTAIIDGIAAGISAGVAAISNAATSAANSALEAAKSALGIESPSTVFRDQVGQMIPAGLIEGIDSLQPRLDARMGDLVAPTVRPSTSPVLAGGGQGGGGGTTVIFQGPVYGWPDFERAVIGAVGGGLRRGVTLGSR